jgi:Helix-turn-helix domain
MRRAHAVKAPAGHASSGALAAPNVSRCPLAPRARRRRRIAPVNARSAPAARASARRSAQNSASAPVGSATSGSERRLAFHLGKDGSRLTRADSRLGARRPTTAFRAGIPTLHLVVRPPSHAARVMRRCVGPWLEAGMQPLELRRLTRAERSELERLAHARTAPARAVERARIISQAHTGAPAGEIATTCGVDPETVRRWLRRFNAAGLTGLEDRPRSGCPPTYPPEQVANRAPSWCPHCPLVRRLLVPRHRRARGTAPRARPASPRPSTPGVRRRVPTAERRRPRHQTNSVTVSLSYLRSTTGPSPRTAPTARSVSSSSGAWTATKACPLRARRRSSPAKSASSV